MKKECVVCGAEFEARGSAKTCSPECSFESKLERARKHHQKNREKIAEQKRKYRQKNREKVAEYRQENREKVAEQQCKYRQKNRDAIAEYDRKYRAERSAALRLVREIREKGLEALL